MKLIKNPGGTWSVKYKAATGKTIKKHLGTKDKAEAELLVKESKIEELEMAAKINALTRDTITSIVAGKNITVSEVVEEWKEFRRNKAHSENTIYSEESIIRMFLEQAGLIKAGIADVTTKHVNEYLNQKDGVSLNMRKLRLSAIRGLFVYALANAYVLKDPAFGAAVDASKLNFKQKEVKPRAPFTVDEFKLIHKEAPYFFRQAASMAWWTGLRLSDIACLEWDSWEDHCLIVHTLKRDKRVALPYDDPLVGSGALKNTLAEIDFADDTYCFPEQRAVISTPKRRSTLSVYFKRILNRLDIQDKSFHCFRHSFVTRCHTEGKSLEGIALWVGHGNAKTTEAYSHS